MRKSFQRMLVVLILLAGWQVVEGAQDDEQKPATKSRAKAAAPAKLTPNQQEWLKERVLPALSVGNSLGVVTLIRDMLPKLSPSTRQVMNDWLAEQKAPSLERMLADARLALLRQGDKKAPPPSTHELPLLIEQYDRQINELLEEAKSKPIFDEQLPAPNTMVAFRDLLWSAHVLNNTLRNAAFLATQSEAIVKSAPGSRSKRSTDVEQPDAAEKFQDARQRAGAMYRDLVERAFELRVRRIEFALQLLETSPDLKERFLAAAAIGTDGEQVKQFLAQPNRPEFQRERLQQAGLETDVTSQLNRAHNLAGDLIIKARQLFAGLHWWRRGRYGRGPEFFGMVKSSAAQTNPVANIALVMPLVAPQPTDPMQTGGIGTPDLDRRHHYWWSWENASFETMKTKSSIETHTSRTYDTRKLSHFDGLINNRFY